MGNTHPKPHLPDMRYFLPKEIWESLARTHLGSISFYRFLVTTSKTTPPHLWPICYDLLPVNQLKQSRLFGLKRDYLNSNPTTTIQEANLYAEAHLNFHMTQLEVRKYLITTFVLPLVTERLRDHTNNQDWNLYVGEEPIFWWSEPEVSLVLSSPNMTDESREKLSWGLEDWGGIFFTFRPMAVS